MTIDQLATPATPLNQRQVWTSQLVFVWDMRDVLTPSFAVELLRLQEVCIESATKLAVVTTPP
jgi:hypothetical protein